MPTRMVIDAHHHFWHYDPATYGWIGDGMQILKRDFTATDLAGEIEGLVDGVISVQARQDVDETRWLLDEARGTPFVVGVVGWVPLAADDVEDRLERLTDESALVGIRHVLQDEPDERYMLREDFNRGVDVLSRFGLAYDVLIYERHLEHAIEFVDRHPDQVFVLDHLAKPCVRKGITEPWATNIRTFAEREHCYCKVSGLATEADWETWTPSDLRPYLDTVFDAFGPQRLMFGSDWPVSLLACDYRRWYHLVDEYVSELTEQERERFWGGTAAEAYGLSM